MCTRWLAILGLCAGSLLLLHEVPAQEIKSGPQLDEQLPGSFPPLNINGKFKDNHHCMVCQFRINPVVMVFVRQAGDGADPEVKKLLEALDKLCVEHYDDYGLSSFVVFLTPAARSSVTVGKGAKEVDVKDTTVIEEAQKREKLVVTLRKESEDSKKLIWTIFPADGEVGTKLKDKPAETVTSLYKLSDKAEVTVILYYRQNVMANFAFGEGKLNADGVNAVSRAVAAMLERVKKGPGGAKKGDAGK